MLKISYTPPAGDVTRCQRKFEITSDVAEHDGTFEYQRFRGPDGEYLHTPLGQHFETYKLVPVETCFWVNPECEKIVHSIYG